MNVVLSSQQLKFLQRISFVVKIFELQIMQNKEMHMYSVHKDAARKYRPKLFYNRHPTYENAFVLIQI
jgi:hypothetical protein